MFRLRYKNLHIKNLKYFFVIICKIVFLLSSRKYNYLRTSPLLRNCIMRFLLYFHCFESILLFKVNFLSKESNINFIWF